MFVYGTLVGAECADEVLDEWSFGPGAILDGLHRIAGEYPTLGPGGETVGRILRTPEVKTLDAYEAVDRGLYVREAVPWAESAPGPDSADVAVYVGDPERLDADATWPGEGPFAARVRRYLGDHSVCVRPQ